MLVKLEYSRQIFEIYSPNFMKIRPLGAELFHLDGQIVRQPEGQACRNKEALFAFLRTRLKMKLIIIIIIVVVVVVLFCMKRTRSRNIV